MKIKLFLLISLLATPTLAQDGSITLYQNLCKSCHQNKEELFTNKKNGKPDANSYNHISEGELPDMKKTSGGKDSDKEMDV